jgi:hypothetical protein
MSTNYINVYVITTLHNFTWKYIISLMSRDISKYVKNQKIVTKSYECFSIQGDHL